MAVTLAVDKYPAEKMIKKLIKTSLRKTKTAFVDQFFAFDSKEIETELRRLGVGHGDVLLVHSSFNDFKGFTGKASDIIDVLERVVGPEGTLMMPSIPFGGTAIEYVRSGKITNIARTPSRTGLVTEIFRRQKGTMRSVHPTHPMLARGAQAEWMLSRHRHARTPCGAESPFDKLLEADGKILFLGASIEAMTFFHFLEELFEDRMPRSPFTDEEFQARVQDGAETVTVPTRLFDPELSRRRNIPVMVPELERLGGCRRARLGVMPLLLVQASTARDAFDNCLRAGTDFYEQ